MLIDLKFSLTEAAKKGRLHLSYLRQLDTSGGGLSTTWEIDGKTSKLTEARRIAKGVYAGFSLDNVIQSWTDWEVSHGFEEDRVLWEAVESAKTDYDREVARSAWAKALGVSRYGSADNLKQIFRRGHMF